MNPRIKWEDPPPAWRHSKYDYFWAGLRERPGKWAIYPGKNLPDYSRIRREGYEATQRGYGTADKKVYIRYVGLKGTEVAN